MALNWNEVQTRAQAFSKEWENEKSENAEAKTFWDQFFTVFGVHRRRVASFESPVKKEAGKGGFIDLLWKGVLLAEHKSRGKDLDRAGTQAFNYFPGLKDRDLPRYVVVSDFARIRLYDLESESGKEEYVEFPLGELHHHVKAFGFMMGMPTQKVKPESPVNRKAVLRLSALHDQLESAGYTGKDLEGLLTRLVFCFFADDTSIFEVQQFYDWVSNETREDGSDTGARLHELFEVLHTDPKKRGKNLAPGLAAFPYVNGGLFNERLAVPAFTSEMRESLLNAAALGWSGVSPAIFGAMFQGLMSKVDRRKLGAHYTQESNILRVIKPLFLDALWAEFESCKSSKKKLKELHEKLRKTRFFDPACGCGNFLVVTYRELRLLEVEILREVYKTDTQQQLQNDIDQEVWLNVDQFYGIEIDEKAAHIARLALWLTDHQMNLRIGEAFGTYFRRLPLKATPNIVYGNALTTDWRDVLDPTKDLVYVIGNPPFIGAKNMDAEQRVEADRVFIGIRKAGILDFVAAWYVKAAQYIAGTKVRGAFVSTSSITQGEQAGVLWSWVLAQGIKIHFAHRTFRWSNEARGNAAVHCVIIGFGIGEWPNKTIYEYDDIKGDPRAVSAKNINPYLVDFDDVVLPRRTKPLSPSAPQLGIGNKPIDGGFYLFNPDQRDAFLRIEPASAPLFRRWIGSDEFLYGYERWCLYVNGTSSEELRTMRHVLARIDSVKKFRKGTGPNADGEMPKKKPAATTQALGDTPLRFHVENIPTKPYCVIPKVSSEKRQFIPLGFEEPSTLSSDLLFVMPDADLYHFGILSSTMHNAWTRYTCGRLESRYRYSGTVVYNNFPWPQEPVGKKREAIEAAAQAVLDARKTSGGSLADLYDPLTMPQLLRDAHTALDRLVDKLYAPEKRGGLTSDSQRVVFLFGIYSDLVDFAAPANKKGASKEPARQVVTAAPKGPRVGKTSSDSKSAAASALSQAATKGGGSGTGSGGPRKK